MPKTLLLADDSVTIQKVVEISFASEDVILHTVDNGDDAILQARELHPDLVLADVVMPCKSGYEVCETLHADPELQHIPVLLLTGTFEAFDENRAAQGGAAGHIAKPFEAQALVDEAMRLIEAHAPPSASKPTSPPVETNEGLSFDEDEFDALRAMDLEHDESPAASLPSESDPLESLPLPWEESSEPDFAELEPALPMSPPVTDPSEETRVESPLSDSDAESLRIDSDDLARSTMLSPGATEPFDVQMTDLQEGSTSRQEHESKTLPSPPGPTALEGIEESPASPRGSAELEPLREQLHETLEKIAWESFGKLSEDLVEQTVARVEAIAWEVIPRMAEILVREEIQKLKEED